jgi:hypothetical protein
MTDTDKVATKVGQKVAEGAAEGAAEKLSDKPFMNTLKDSWIVILVVVAMFVMVLVVLYIVYMIRTNKLQNVTLQARMLAMDNRELVPFKVNSNVMSLVTNGQEFSYGFWIFLGNRYDATNDHKVIFQRGNTSTTSVARTTFTTNTNPIIMLDGTSNRMYFAIATSKVAQVMGALEITPARVVQTNAATTKYDSGYLVTHIDYIPLQRWVHIACVLKDTSLYVYMDGDLYSVVTINDMDRSVSDLKPMVMGTNGDLLIGDMLYNTPGYISLSKFYNYAMTQKDIMESYKQGPVKKSWLSYIGLGQYGVRSPVYEVNG